MYTQENYKLLGDTWLIAYVTLVERQLQGEGGPLLWIAPTKFSLAFILEIYLKGCLVKYYSHDPKVSELLDGHKLFKIWKKLKENKSFVTEFEIPEEMFHDFDLEKSKLEDYNNKYLARNNFWEITDIIELMKYTTDLKYTGLQYKKLNYPHQPRGYITYPENIARLFKKLRDNLKSSDSLNDALLNELTRKNTSLSSSGKEFIEMIL